MKRINFMKFSVLFLLSLSAVVFAQEYNYGFSVAPLVQWNKETYEIYHYDLNKKLTIVQYERARKYYGVGFYYIGNWRFGSKNEIVIKPGILSTESLFSSVQIGIMYRRPFYGKNKISLGFNMEILSLYPDGNPLPNPVNGTIDLSISSFVMDRINLVVLLSKPVSKYYGKYIEPTNSEGIGWVKTYVDYKLQLGFELFF